MGYVVHGSLEHPVPAFYSIVRPGQVKEHAVMHVPRFNRVPDFLDRTPCSRDYDGGGGLCEVIMYEHSVTYVVQYLSII